MDIRKRVSERTGNTTYQARYYYNDAQGLIRRESQTFKRKADAERFLRAKNAELHLGTHVDPRSGAILFRQVAEEWHKSNGWLDLKETSKARYASVLRVHLLPRWGERKIGSIRRGDVDAWVAELRQVMPAGTVRKIHSTFRAALSFAVLTERLNTNPAVGVRLPRVPHRDIDRLFLDEQEVNVLADAVEPRYRAVILLAAWGGLRAGEIWGLKRRWLDVDRGRLTVADTLVTVHGQGLVWTSTKTHERRIVSLPLFLCEVLNAHMREFTEAGPDALVFTDRIGLPQGQTAFTRDVFKPAVRAALSEDKRGLRFHDLRHTAAALMIAHDLSPKFISDQLGHRDIGITFNRYGHLLKSVADAAMDKLETGYRASVSPPPGQPA